MWRGAVKDNSQKLGQNKSQNTWEYLPKKLWWPFCSDSSFYSVIGESRIFLHKSTFIVYHWKCTRLIRYGNAVECVEEQQTKDCAVFCVCQSILDRPPTTHQLCGHTIIVSKYRRRVHQTERAEENSKSTNIHRVSWIFFYRIQIL